jgi:RNA polymerase sigma factor (sigma-70 family)
VRKLCPSTLGITAEEIEQESRVRLWQALRREREITDPASYLYRIAATAAIDAVRRVRARHETSIAGEPDAAADAGVAEILAAPDRSPEDLVIGREVGDRVVVALSRLADNRRRAVGLHLRGFTSMEIGALLGWTEPKARNLTYRGLSDLRALLRGEEIGNENGTQT